MKTGNSADPPQSSGQGDQSSDVELEKDFEKNLQGNSKPSKKANKGKTPVTTKKTKALPSETSESNLVDFLEKSLSKDHEFFERLAEKEAERELKSQKLMFDCIKEIAKIFKRRQLSRRTLDNHTFLYITYIYFLFFHRYC